MSTFKEKYHSLLRFGTELLGLDLKYFVSGGFWKTTGTVVSNVLAALLLVVFANFLPKETYGLYRYILSLIGILTMFSLTGMNTAVTQAVAAGNDGALKASIKYQFKWNFVMTSVSWALAAYYLWYQNTAIAITLFILGLTVPITYTFNTYNAYLEGKKDFKRKSIFLAWSSVIYVAGMLPAIYFGKDIIWLIIAYTATSLLSNWFFYIKTLKIYNPPDNNASEAITYGRHLTFLNLITPIMGQIDNIVLGHFWGVDQLAIYSLAGAMPDKIGPFIKQITGIGLPKLAPKSTKEINSVFNKRLLQSIAAGALIAAAYIVIAPFIFKYILPKYLESVFYSQILALNFIFIVPTGYIGAVFGSKKLLTRPLFVTTGFIVNGFKILLYVIFGIYGGILGLVLAQIIYQIFSVLVSIIMWKYEMRNYK